MKDERILSKEEKAFEEYGINRHISQMKKEIKSLKQMKEKK